MFYIILYYLYKIKIYKFIDKNYVELGIGVKLKICVIWLNYLI